MLKTEELDEVGDTYVVIVSRGHLHDAEALAVCIRKPLAYLGMQIAHMGFAVTLLGVALTSQLSEERDLRMVPGDVVSVGQT